MQRIDCRWINWRWQCLLVYGSSPFINTQNDPRRWGNLLLHSKCRLCVKSILRKRGKKRKQGGGENSAQILMRRDWQTDKEDTVIQWRHDNLATHFMVTNNQKSFYRWHIKEHLVYASVNPIDYFVISLSLTCSNVLYLSHKYWIFWLDKLLYRHNPIKVCVLRSLPVTFCGVRSAAATVPLSLADNKRLLMLRRSLGAHHYFSLSLNNLCCSNVPQDSFHQSIN